MWLLIMARRARQVADQLRRLGGLLHSSNRVVGRGVACVNLNRVRVRWWLDIGVVIRTLARWIASEAEHVGKILAELTSAGKASARDALRISGSLSCILRSLCIVN